MSSVTVMHAIGCGKRLDGVHCGEGGDLEAQRGQLKNGGRTVNCLA